MAEGDTFTCGDPDGYAARFGDVRVDLTVTGAGEFRARLVRLKMKHLQVYWCREDLPRIARISLPPERIFVSFPVGPESLTSNGLVLRKGDLILHGRGERTHQRSENACQWALISFSPEQFANCSKALLGHSIAPPQVSRIVRPPRAEWLGLQRLVRQACGLAEAQQKLFSPDVARALEQEILDAVIHCVASKGRDEKSRTRHHHAAVMVRFEEELDKYLDQKVAMPTLCAAIGVAERTLRMCCAEFLGVGPRRYLLLRRLNRARAALRRADPATASVAQVARNHQFLELGRFAVKYRITFGESPSTTLHRDPRI
jgi:AraC-like DNA-binding protein